MKAAVDLKPTLTIIKTEKVDLELFPSPGEWRQQGPHPSSGSPPILLWVALLPQEPRMQRPGRLTVGGPRPLVFFFGGGWYLFSQLLFFFFGD